MCIPAISNSCTKATKNPKNIRSHARYVQTRENIVFSHFLFRQAMFLLYQQFPKTRMESARERKSEKLFTRERSRFIYADASGMRNILS